MISRLALRLALLLILGLCSACSSFDARWKSAASPGAATRWAGRWTSEKHQTSGGSPVGGRLRAVIEPAAGQKLTVHFYANWLVFASDYTMTLEPDLAGPRRANVREFSGTHELSKMFGGTYHYKVQLSGDQLNARYTSSYDHGTFALQRVRLSKDCFPVDARH
jgi:hypothetical protein